MASLYKRKEVWWGRFRFRGREYRKTLRTASKAEARRKLRAWQEGKISELAAVPIDDAKPHTWRQAVVKYMQEVMPHNVGPKTAKRYSVSFRQVDGMLSDKRLADIGHDEVTAVAYRKGPTVATRRRDMTACSQVFRAAMAFGMADRNPFKDIDLSAVVKERRDPIVLPRDADVKRFIKACPVPLNCMVRLLLHSGIRLDEAAGLTWTDVTLTGPNPFLDIVGKGRKRRAVSLNEMAISAIQDTTRHLHSDYVFWHGNGKRYKQASTQLARIRRRIGVPFKTHDLRHKFAVDYLKAGGSIYRLQQILGHSSIAVTEMYLSHIPPEQAEMAKRGVV